MKNTNKIIFVTLLSFGVYFFLDERFFRTIREWLNEQINHLGFSHIITYLIVGIPIFIGLIWIHNISSLYNSLGLNKNIIKALFFALLCTLPMFIGYAIVFEYNSNFSLNTFLISILCAAFFEELYFRGFLFGQIFRFTQWGFILSIIIGAILFGMVHLYQGTGLNEIIGIFMITFLGGILYGWVFVEWNYNLWVPIFLHLLMNLSWGLFSAGENALGGLYSNVFRIATIALIIILTVVYKRKSNKKFVVNKNTLWMKNKNWLKHG
jgi:membrane protease YdiL (CAAX protease family)